MRTAFVLAGGGSLAATQVGMLRALLEAGIKPDFMVGTSAGAVNAFCFARHPNRTGVDRLEHLWRGLRRRDVFPLDIWQLLTGLVGLGDGLVPPGRLRRFLEREIGDVRLEDTRLPVHLVATDLAEGRPVVLSEGSAVQALLATSAMPGVFPPVLIDDRPLVDGGVSADTPVRQAEDLGATVTYVLPTIGPTSPGELPRGAVRLLAQAINQLFGRAVASEVAAMRGTVHVLPAPAHDLPNPFDFGSTERLIKAGYQAASKALETPARPRLATA